MIRHNISGLYAITPDLKDFNLYKDTTKAILDAGVQLLQYRNKQPGKQERFAQAKCLKKWCKQSGAIFIINDDLELAHALQADGIHLGMDDASLFQARNLLGPGKIIGISCYNSLKRAQKAILEGADYIAFGSFFSSETKPHAQRTSLSLLKEARNSLDVPIVAIGGITPQNSRQLIEAGADALAVVHALYSGDDPAYTVKEFSKLFKLEKQLND
ncbi:MAG: thiamine phosphate synthase [Pseudomonadota bacterium]|nr:thiamine phosphate synthase [Pseudomonadota bacterium]